MNFCRRNQKHCRIFYFYGQLERRFNLSHCFWWTFLLFYFVHPVDSEPCSVCTLLARTFQHGIKQTEKAHFGGGNTAWEQEKLGKYSRSETRLVEIMEHLCKKTDDIKVDKDDGDRCHVMVEEHEEILETWYFHKQTTFPNLEKWLCFETLKVCCPQNTWGKTCDPCPGDPDRPCYGRGKCDGAGTRQGTGKCKCDVGYQGNLCRICANNFYPSFQNDTNVTCDPCDIACKGGCSGSGPSNCIGCKSGWLLNEKGCEDIDECAKNLCDGEHEICKNTPGSFECSCAQGYKKESNRCVLDVTDIKNDSTSSNETSSVDENSDDTDVSSDDDKNENDVAKDEL